MSFSSQVALNDPTNAGGSSDAVLVYDLQQALAQWSAHISGLGTLVVQLNIVQSAVGRADGGSTSTYAAGTFNGRTVYAPSSLYELTTGRHESGTTSDITIDVSPSYFSNLDLSKDLNYGDQSAPNTLSPVGVFMHELMHGFGQDGFYDQSGNLPATYESSFDTLIQKNADGSASYIGRNAAENGPITLTSSSPYGENYYHFGNTLSDLYRSPTTVQDPLTLDLMNGIVFFDNYNYSISPLDLGVLKDLGYTLTGITLNIAGNAGSTNVIDHQITGTIDVADAMTPIQLYDNGQAVGSPIIANAAGAFSTIVDFALDGSNIISAQATNSSGTTGASNTLAFTLDSSSNASAFAPITNIPGQDVYALYDALLGRAPDPGGFNAWTNAIDNGTLSVAQVTNDFLASPEFTAAYGDYNNQSPTQFVTDLYADALHRAPDPGGLSNWVTAIQSGLSRQQVAADFAFSPEHLADIQAPLASSGLEPSVSGADVARLYYGLLDRAPDLAGLTGWDNAISSGALTLNQVAADFASSPEFTSTHSGSDAAFVTALYEGALGRAPDAQGDANWLNALATGTTRATVALDFAESPEAISRTSAAISAFHVA